MERTAPWLKKQYLSGYQKILLGVIAASVRESQRWLPSVKHLAKMIKEDPTLRMNWECGISLCKNFLPGKTGDDVLGLVDAACRTPPSYSRSDLVGFPINVIFVELMENENGRSFFANQKVNNALKDILTDYAAMLETPLSLHHMNVESPDGWFCPDACSQIGYEQYECQPEKPHYGFATWNQWFLRRFKPGYRVVGAGSPQGVSPERVIVNSCEATPIMFPIQPRLDVKESDTFWLKGDVYSLRDMFAADKFGKHALTQSFIGGTVYQAYLSATSYHRWHAPVDGVITDVYSIPGTYYLNQSQFFSFDPDTPFYSEPFLSSVSTRMVIAIEATNKSIGKVAIVYIGMGEASSCVNTVHIGEQVKQGQEIGYFQFGGSSHVIVFEKKARLKFTSELYLKDATRGQAPKQQKVNSFLAELLDD